MRNGESFTTPDYAHSNIAIIQLLMAVRGVTALKQSRTSRCRSHVPVLELAGTAEILEELDG